MRIIGGSKRGMGLLGPKGRTVTRPITDRPPVQVQNAYGHDVIGRLLGCVLRTGRWAGALSAGRWVTFVEDRSATEPERTQGRVCGGVTSVRMRGRWVPGAVELGPYDWILLDPPYKMSSSESPLGRLLVLLCEQVAAGGFVAVRTHERAELLDVYGGMRVIDRRRWGTMAIALLQVEGGTAGHDEPGTGDQDYSASE